MRFYDLDGGTIRLDGVDIATMRRDDVRGEIGMVLQDAWLFGGTIRDNIAYGDHGATDEQILEAARISYVDRFVHSLPDGYDTVVDDQGSNLSAGERQLVTIARAFLADPAILILDEATSSVDTRTEVLDPAGDGRAARRPHQLRHRPPPLDDPRRRHDPRDGGRPHRRTGRPRRAARPRRRVLTGCTTPSSPGRSSTNSSSAGPAPPCEGRSSPTVRRDQRPAAAEELADPLGGPTDERSLGGDDQRPFHQRRVLGEHGDDAFGGGDVGGRDAELVPSFAPDEPGRLVLELGEDRPQLVGARRRFEILDDVDR